MPTKVEGVGGGLQSVGPERIGGLGDWHSTIMGVLEMSRRTGVGGTPLIPFAYSWSPSNPAGMCCVRRYGEDWRE